MIVPFIVLAAAGAIAVDPISFDQQNDEQALIDYMSSGQKLFEIGNSTMSYEDFKSRVMDSKYLDLKEEKLMRTAPIKLAAGQDNLVVPESFDAREKWPECKSIKLIRDQGNCASCWAVSVASVMSDRLCIASGQKIQKLLSATDIVACCDECSPKPCEGGSPLRAWEYIKSFGVCSGGPYNSKNVCKPYAFPPCNKSKKDKMLYGPLCDFNITLPRPMCLKKCLQDYTTFYTEDKVYGNHYELSDEKEIQREIMTFGPVQASMKLYKDFHNYKSGIYHHNYTSEEKEFYHAVKIIGWGVEKIKNINVKYWLVSNSWGANRGEDGLYRIIRGAPESIGGIEISVHAGRPKIQ